MKLFKYILILVPFKSIEFRLSLPYNNLIWYSYKDNYYNISKWS